MIVIPENAWAVSADDILSEMDKLVATGESGVVEVDCSRITRVTSSLINVLWQARQRCVNAGLEIRLKSPSADLIRVLRLLDLYEIFMDGEPYTEKLPIGAFCLPGGCGGQVLELKFKPETKEIDNAITAFRRFLEELKLNGTSAFELETAFYEVATNIRLHGRLANNDQVEFKAQCLPDRLSMKFVDPGQPFNFDSRQVSFDPQQAMDDGQKRGFGLVMIDRMTDDIHYERKDKRFNVLTLEKKWSGFDE